MGAYRRFRDRRRLLPTPQMIHVDRLAEMLEVDPSEVADDVAELDGELEGYDGFLALPEDEVLAYLTTWMGLGPGSPDSQRRAARGLYDWWRKHQAVMP